MDDSIIVELFLNRNENAISEAKSKYEDYCVYIADNILRDRQEAEECLNMALLAVWNKYSASKSRKSQNVSRKNHKADRHRQMEKEQSA